MKYLLLLLQSMTWKFLENFTNIENLSMFRLLWIKLAFFFLKEACQLE